MAKHLRFPGSSMLCRHDFQRNSNIGSRRPRLRQTTRNPSEACVNFNFEGPPSSDTAPTFGGKCELPVPSAGIRASVPGHPCRNANVVEPFVVKRISLDPKSIFLSSLKPELPDGRFGRGALTVNLPWLSRVNAFTVDRHPSGNPLQSLHLFWIQLSRIRKRKVQKKIAILAHDIHQQIDNFLRRLVMCTLLIVPLADARIRPLPRDGRDSVEDTSLPVSAPTPPCVTSLSDL